MNLIIKLVALALCLACTFGVLVLSYPKGATPPNDDSQTPDDKTDASAFGIDIVDTEKAKYGYAEMVDDLAALKARYPDKMKYETIGDSLDGRKIYAVTLGASDAENQIVISAGIHAREYMTPMLVMAQLEYLLYNYNTASYKGVALSDIFKEYCFCIMPMCNPDGITLAQSGIDSIRSAELRDTIRKIYSLDKENEITELPFEEYLTIWKANARGVDLNRNFDTDDFGTYPNMSRPCFMNHQGAYPLSEPESSAMVNYVKSLENPVLSLAIHSQGEIIYYNCGQKNLSDAEALAKKIGEFTKYSLEYEARHYSAFDDWCNKKMNIPSVTVETGSRPCPLPISEFKSIWNTNRDLWLFAALYHKNIKENQS